MAAKISAFTAPNLDTFSGVFAVVPDSLQPASSLESSIRHIPEAFVPLGSDVWNEVKASQDLSPLSHALSTQGRVAFVAFDHLELEPAAQLNLVLGANDDGILNSLKSFNSKSDAYTKLSGAGLLPNVRHFRCRFKDLEKCVRSSGIAPSNVVVKPAVGSGGQGVFRFSTAVDVKEFMKAYLARAGIQPSDLELSVMEYIGGEDVDVQEICLDGVRLDGQVQFLASHDKILSENLPPYRDKIISSPGEVFRDEWRPVVESWLTELGADNTTFHIEARVRGGEVIPIDFAARPGGGFISSMCAATSGVDLRLIHLYLMSGRKDLVTAAFNLKVPTHKASAIGAFYMQGKSRVDTGALAVLEANLKQDGQVLGYHLSAQTGASGVLFPSASLSLCIGATSRDEAINLMQKIATDQGFASSAPFQPN